MHLLGGVTWKCGGSGGGWTGGGGRLCWLLWRWRFGGARPCKASLTSSTKSAAEMLKHCNAHTNKKSQSQPHFPFEKNVFCQEKRHCQYSTCTLAKKKSNQKSIKKWYFISGVESVSIIRLPLFFLVVLEKIIYGRRIFFEELVSVRCSKSYYYLANANGY